MERILRGNIFLKRNWDIHGLQGRPCFREGENSLQGFTSIFLTYGGANEVYSKHRERFDNTVFLSAVGRQRDFRLHKPCKLALVWR